MSTESPMNTSARRTTEYRYNVEGLLEELVCWNGEAGEQVTRWEYGTEGSGGGIARADLVRAKVYPDGGRNEYGYNFQGEVVRMEDPNGTVHEYEYDAVGRMTSDQVETLGSGVDGAIRAIEVSFLARGDVHQVTSYTDVAMTTVANQIEYGYNGRPQVVEEKQAHGGAVGGGTPSVGYAYEDGTDNTVRRTEITYPNGQVVSFAYDGVMDSHWDRVTKIQHVGSSVTTDLAVYSRMGLNMVVRRLEANGLEMTAIAPEGQSTGDAGDPYIGYDRFGRLEDARWIRTSNGAGRERVEYGFDRVGNRVWRRNREAESELFDEAYGYDGLYQVKSLDRGKLNQNRTAIGGVPVKGERWNYDPMGNWLRYETLEDGELAIDRPGTYNAANELLFLYESNAHLGHDAAGNMTKVPRPANFAEGYRLKWDAWNRLVEVADEATEAIAAQYAYDGLFRRMTKKTGFPSSIVTRHYYYSDQWQILEERLDASTNAERQFVWGLQGLDDLVCRDELNTSTGALTRRLWALNDGKNVTAIALGNDVVERYAYDAFGMPIVLTANFSPRAGNASEYGWETRFCGYRWDGETQFYQVRFRYYHPQLGRWASRDPIEEKGGSNLYKLLWNSPANHVDIDGRFAPNPGTVIGSIGGPPGAVVGTAIGAAVIWAFVASGDENRPPVPVPQPNPAPPPQPAPDPDPEYGPNFDRKLRDDCVEIRAKYNAALKDYRLLLGKKPPEPKGSPEYCEWFADLISAWKRHAKGRDEWSNRNCDSDSGGWNDPADPKPDGKTEDRRRNGHEIARSNANKSLKDLEDKYERYCGQC